MAGNRQEWYAQTPREAEAFSRLLIIVGLRRIGYFQAEILHRRNDLHMTQREAVESVFDDVKTGRLR